jgi:putative flippase GtrA
VRFWRFTLVGLLGFAVQLTVLALLVRLGVHYLAATGVAVEAAVLHNFVWHERWTWADRAPAPDSRVARLWRFHLLNGSVSLGGNLLIVRLLVGGVGLSPLAGNIVSVLACAAINFAGADRLVFRHTITFRFFVRRLRNASSGDGGGAGRRSGGGAFGAGAGRRDQSGGAQSR